MKKWLFIIPTLLILGAAAFFMLPESWKRSLKDKKSAWIGIDRVVSVYSHDGQKIREYTGQIDVTTENNRILFDIKGKRVIIHNAITIIEEKE